MPSADGKPWLEFARLQFATSVIWLALSPVVLALARRFRMDANNWKRVLPLHVVFGMTTGVLHTGLMRLTGLSEVPVLSPGNMNPLTGDFFCLLRIVGLVARSRLRRMVSHARVRGGTPLGAHRGVALSIATGATASALPALHP